MHQIEIVLNNPSDKDKCGIYKITIGNRFYIGSSLIIGRRMKDHKSVINRMLKKFPSIDEKEYYLWFVVQYIKRNPSIKKIYVDVTDYYEPQDHKEMRHIEWEIINKEGESGLLLNSKQPQKSYNTISHLFGDCDFIDQS